MRKEDKSTIIEQIAATVKEYGHFYLVDVTAMNAAATSALRRDCFKSDIKLMVVKNTLLHKALESLEEDFSPLYGSLKGTTAVMFTNTANVPANLIKDKANDGRTKTFPRICGEGNPKHHQQRDKTTVGNNSLHRNDHCRQTALIGLHRAYRHRLLRIQDRHRYRRHREHL